MDHLVSVIMPAYNYGRYIGEAIGSVLSQTYDNLEIVVVDDGSTDNTCEVVGGFIGKLKRKVRYYYQKNKGPGAARNFAIKEARGEYLAFLDADDLWLPDKLKLQMEMFAGNPDIGFIHTNYKLFNAEGEIVNYRFGITSLSQLSGNIFPYLLRENIINGSTIIARKALLIEAGGFAEEYLSEDYILWLKMARKSKAGYIRDPLIKCRKHLDNKRDIAVLYASVRRVIDKIISEYPEIKDDPECRVSLRYREAKICYEIGYAYFLKKQMRQARSSLCVSIKNKFTPTAFKYFLLTFIDPVIIGRVMAHRKA